VPAEPTQVFMRWGQVAHVDLEKTNGPDDTVRDAINAHLQMAQ
jgi:hypothetical protein